MYDSVVSFLYWASFTKLNMKKCISKSFTQEMWYSWQIELVRGEKVCILQKLLSLCKFMCKETHLYKPWPIDFVSIKNEIFKKIGAAFVLTTWKKAIQNQVINE